MSYLPGEVKENLVSLSSSLKGLKELLKSVQESKSLALSNLRTQDSLKARVALAYSLNSVHYIHLKLQGKNVQDHPVSKELELIKSTALKVQQPLQSNNF